MDEKSVRYLKALPPWAAAYLARFAAAGADTLPVSGFRVPPSGKGGEIAKALTEAGLPCVAWTGLRDGGVVLAPGKKGIEDQKKLFNHPLMAAARALCPDGNPFDAAAFAGAVARVDPDTVAPAEAAAPAAAADPGLTAEEYVEEIKSLGLGHLVKAVKDAVPALSAAELVDESRWAGDTNACYDVDEFASCKRYTAFPTLRLLAIAGLLLDRKGGKDADVRLCAKELGLPDRDDADCALDASEMVTSVAAIRNGGSIPNSGIYFCGIPGSGLPVRVRRGTPNSSYVDTGSTGARDASGASERLVGDGVSCSRTGFLYQQCDRLFSADTVQAARAAIYALGDNPGRTRIRWLYVCAGWRASINRVSMLRPDLDKISRAAARAVSLLTGHRTILLDHRPIASATRVRYLGDQTSGAKAVSLAVTMLVDLASGAAEVVDGVPEITSAPGHTGPVGAHQPFVAGSFVSKAAAFAAALACDDPEQAVGLGYAFIGDGLSTLPFRGRHQAPVSAYAVDMDCVFCAMDDSARQLTGRAGSRDRMLRLQAGIADAVRAAFGGAPVFSAPPRIPSRLAPTLSGAGADEMLDALRTLAVPYLLLPQVDELRPQREGSRPAGTFRFLESGGPALPGPWEPAVRVAGALRKLAADAADDMSAGGASDMIDAARIPVPASVRSADAYMGSGSTNPPYITTASYGNQPLEDTECTSERLVHTDTVLDTVTVVTRFSLAAWNALPRGKRAAATTKIGRLITRHLAGFSFKPGPGMFAAAAGADYTLAYDGAAKNRLVLTYRFSPAVVDAVWKRFNGIVPGLFLADHHDGCVPDEALLLTNGFGPTAMSVPVDKRVPADAAAQHAA